MICATLSGSQRGLDRRGRRARSVEVASRAACSGGRNSLRHRLGEHADVGRLGAQLERAGLELGQVEQVGRQRSAAARPARAPARGTRWRVSASRSSSCEQLEEPAEREDRRAQLVRGGGDEALARGVELPSWRCMSLSATASWPSSSVASTGKRPREVAARRPARAACSRRLIRARQRARDAGSRRASATASAMPPAIEDPPADRARRSPRRRCSGVGVHDDARDRGRRAAAAARPGRAGRSLRRLGARSRSRRVLRRLQRDLELQVARVRLGRRVGDRP